MVAPTTPRFGFVPEVNLSRSYLLRAYDKLQAGDVISAGVLMREGVITHLRAMAVWYDCEPKVQKAKRKKFLRPADYIRALDKAGKLGDCREWFDDMIEVGNKCAHAMPIPASMVKSCISFAHVMIDGGAV